MNPNEEDINADEVEVLVGGEGVQQEFTENLTGVKPDETRTFIVDYPEDFTTQRTWPARKSNTSRSNRRQDERTA